jgi:hypothetical protein
MESRRGRWPSLVRPAWAAVLLASSCGWILGSCGRDEAPQLPDGAFLAGEAEALRPLLDGLIGLEGTPLARSARSWRERLEGCATFQARAPELDVAALLGAVRCAPVLGLDPALAELRGDADVVFVAPLGVLGRIAGRLRARPDGSVSLEARVEGDRAGRSSPLLALVSGAPGRRVLSSADTVLHARLRPDSLDFESLLRPDSQADRLFRLRNDLLLGTLLDGTVELAAYLPEPGRLMPSVAVAVGVEVRAAAVAAMEKFLGDLEATWPVRRRSFSAEGLEGACLPDLRILPELAPCYVAGADFLLVGWNPGSVHAALRPDVGPGPGDDGGLWLHLDRLPRADALLREAAAPHSPPVRFDYAWQRLRLTTRRQGETLAIEADLVAKEAS